MIPGCHVVACPRRGVTPAAGIRGTGQDKRPAAGDEPTRPFVRAARHLHSVHVVKLRVGPADSLAVMDDGEINGVGGNIEDGGLVHVVPPPADAGRSETGVLIPPPPPYRSTCEIREDTHSRPDFSGIEGAIGVMEKGVRGQSRTEDGVRAVKFDAGVHDHDCAKPLRTQVPDQSRRVGEGRRVPGENAIAVHVVDVEVENIAGHPARPKAPGDLANAALGRVTEPALLIAERPEWREGHAPHKLSETGKDR